MKYLIAIMAVLATSLSPALAASAEDKRAVLENYADIAHAVYEDSLTTAQDLHDAIEALLDEPTEASLEAARAAWVAARVPYQQSEAYRFGNPLVDAWEDRKSTRLNSSH